MADVKLKPCPFCGGEGILRSQPFSSYVICQRCGAGTGLVKISTEYSSNEKAAENWNRRAEPKGGESNE